MHSPQQRRNLCQVIINVWQSYKRPRGYRLEGSILEILALDSANILGNELALTTMLRIGRKYLSNSDISKILLFTSSTHQTHFFFSNINDSQEPLPCIIYTLL